MQIPPKKQFYLILLGFYYNLKLHCIYIAKGVMISRNPPSPHKFPSRLNLLSLNKRNNKWQSFCFPPNLE